MKFAWVRRPSAVAAVLAAFGIVAGCSSDRVESDLRATEGNLVNALPAAVEDYNFAIGTQNIGARYKFTEESRAIEGAKRMLEMGSSIMKFDESLLDNPGEMEALFKMPFKTYFFWAKESQNWSDGLSEDESKKLYSAFYELAARLLKTYNRSGKTFYIGHWEGDWLLLGGSKKENLEKKITPDSREVKGMIDWLNIRQKAVDDARKNTPHENVAIYHYAEVNRVLDAMEQGKTRMINAVIPKTNVDYISYSSYDVQRSDGEKITKTLDYIEQQLPDKGGLPTDTKRVFIGEFGVAADWLKGSGDLYDANTKKAHDRENRAVMAKYLRWGTPYVLYWEVYNNEMTDQGKQRGFWLIDDKNEKWPLFSTFANLYKDGKSYVAKYYRDNGKVPSAEDYQRWAADYLERP